MRTDDPRGLSYDDAQVTVDDQGGSVSISLDISTGPKCTLAGSAAQFGSFRNMGGSYTCQDGSQGVWSISNALVTNSGFTGTYSGPAGHIGGKITNGTISGARR